MPDLDYQLPIHNLPSDLRMPLYDSLPLSLRFSEAFNFFYYYLTSLHLTTSHTNSMVIVRLHLPQEILLHYISSGHLINFSRDYLSHMVSIIGQHHLPTRQLPQRLHRINYDMNQITNTFNLSNNYIWNFHMPLRLPELLSYYDQPQQLQDHHYKAISAIMHKSSTYYGFTLLTATNLPMQYKLLLHKLLTTFQQPLPPPEINYTCLRGGPDFLTTFTTNHYASLDHRTGQQQGYRVQHWTKHT